MAPAVAGGVAAQLIPTPDGGGDDALALGVPVTTSIFPPMTTTPDSLDSLVRLSHLLGAETRLVQPGGGNTSIKVGDALLVKGSGTDLRTIGREGFTRLSLARLAPLA